MITLILAHTCFISIQIIGACLWHYVTGNLFALTAQTRPFLTGISSCSESDSQTSYGKIWLIPPPPPPPTHTHMYEYIHIIQNLQPTRQFKQKRKRKKTLFIVSHEWPKKWSLEFRQNDLTEMTTCLQHSTGKKSNNVCIYNKRLVQIFQGNTDVRTTEAPFQARVLKQSLLALPSFSQLWARQFVGLVCSLQSLHKDRIACWGVLTVSDTHGVFPALNVEVKS